MVFKHLIGCLTSKSEALFTSRLFSTCRPKIVLYLFLLMDFEGMLKDKHKNAKHKNAAKKWLSFLPDYLLTIYLTF